MVDRLGLLSIYFCVKKSYNLKGRNRKSKYHISMAPKSRLYLRFQLSKLLPQNTLTSTFLRPSYLCHLNKNKTLT